MAPRCDGIFGTWHKILIPVSHLNHEGLLMFLELLHLVNCFEFSIRLQFAGIAGGRSWNYHKQALETVHKNNDLHHFLISYFPKGLAIHDFQITSNQLFSPGQPCVAISHKGIFSTDGGRQWSRRILWLDIIKEVRGQLAFSANPMHHISISVGLLLPLSEPHGGRCQKNDLRVLDLDGPTLLWCEEAHCSKGSNGCLSESGYFHGQNIA